MRSFPQKGLGFEPQHRATWLRCPVPLFSPTGLGPYLRSPCSWICKSREQMVLNKGMHTTLHHMISVLSIVTEHTRSSPWDGAILSSSYWQQLQVKGSPITDFHTLRWQWHPLCLSLCRCELTDPAATVWCWAGEAWGFSEDVLQGFRIQLHRVIYALGEAEAWTGTGVYWKD